VAVGEDVVGFFNGEGFKSEAIDGFDDGVVELAE